MLDSIAKEKSGVKKWIEIMAIKGRGVRRFLNLSITNLQLF